MMKIYIYLLIFSSYLFSSSQIVFVLANTNKSQKAKLITYEKINNHFKQISKPIDVNIGQNGLAWGISDLFILDKKQLNLKVEGDKKAVKGVYKLSKVYGYSKNVDTKMPYIQSSKNLICVDDISSSNYNKIVKTNNKKEYNSYENMLLSNETYEYLIKVEHNEKALKSKGSCIFLHVENPKKKQTSGCTSMKINQIKKLISWLDIKKEPILIQVDKFSCLTMKKKYPFLNCKID